MNETNEKELIVQEIFKSTNAKITEDDPLVEAILGFKYIIKEASQDLINNREDLKEWAGIFTSRFEDDIAEIALRNNTKLEILEHEIKEVVEAVSKKLETISETALTGFDEKAKDLNMLLTKLQVNHERDNSENFAKHFAKIDEKYQQMLEIQAQNHAFSQREILFGVGGLVAGVIICLLAFFIVR
ncbi:hypothetical protein LP087_13770 (plasmid) [Moraxella bovis]|uniref:hypothetical protein n=1 Tax=Moraxella bovis TaxID=476 RepID=UPI0022276B3A|nr:hypothetical protein [Moraxella bovis]UZA34035.1 hypothetical protein LP087_13770 [Moraxella bovis]UZA49995.1 hypothetical protein LP100_14025 [Moraxella bovis]